MDITGFIHRLYFVNIGGLSTYDVIKDIYLQEHSQMNKKIIFPYTPFGRFWGPWPIWPPSPPRPPHRPWGPGPRPGPWYGPGPRPGPGPWWIR